MKRAMEYEAEDGERFETPAECKQHETNHFDIWSKLLAGAFARAELAERRCDELEAELAEMKQTRTTSPPMMEKNP